MNVQESFNKFVKDSKRVLKVSKKPDTLGVVIVGVIGFVVFLLGALIGL